MNHLIVVPNLAPTAWSTRPGGTRPSVKLVPVASTGTPTQPSRGGFTLVEMLSVLGIIAILSSLIVPTFKGIGSAGRVGTIGNQFAELAGLARQNSLSKNCLSAFVLLTDSRSAGTYQAMAVFQLLPRTDGAATSSADWKQITNWSTLPAGVCVDVALAPSPEAANDPSCTFQDASAQNSSAPTSLPPALGYNGGMVSSYKFIIFLSGGGLLNGNSVRAELIEGNLPPSPAGTIPPAVYTHPLPNTSNPVLPSNYYRVTLVSATGRVKIDRP